MLEIPLPIDLKPDWVNLFKRIFDGAQGNIISLDGVPTGDMLKPNQIGYYGNDIYWCTSNGTKIKLSGSAWT